MPIHRSALPLLVSALLLFGLTSACSAFGPAEDDPVERIDLTPPPTRTPPPAFIFPTYTPIPIGQPLPTLTPFKPGPMPTRPDDSTPSAGLDPSQPPAPQTPQAPGAPLVIHWVAGAKGKRITPESNEATVKITANFSGGQAPFQFYDEGILMPRNPFTLLAHCGVDFVHTLEIVSADGQRASTPYYVSVKCP